MSRFREKYFVFILNHAMASSSGNRTKRQKKIEDILFFILAFISAQDTKEKATNSTYIYERENNDSCSSNDRNTTVVDC